MEITLFPTHRNNIPSKKKELTEITLNTRNWKHLKLIINIFLRVKLMIKIYDAIFH